MALTPLTWRMLPPVTVTTPNTIHTLLDAIYSAGTSSTYVDGEDRTIALTTKWSWYLDNTASVNNGFTTAVYAEPPSGGSAMNQKIIVSGSIAAPTALRYQKETAFVASRPLVGIAKNAGTYTHWTDAVASSGISTPFTSGDFSGYCTAGDLGTAAYTTVYMYESQEAIMVFAVVANIVRFGFIAGAFIDPFSANTLNVESDGRVYGLTSLKQVTAGMDSAFFSTVVNSLFSGSSTALATNCFFFVSGSATVRHAARSTTINGSLVSMVASNGNIPLIPYQIVYSGGLYAGQLREIFVTKNSILGNSLSETIGSTTTYKGYAIGYSDSISNHTLLLKR